MSVIEIPEDLFRAIERGTNNFRYRGVPCQKNPIDFAIYTQLLWKARPRTIIEVGTYHGGSALWLRDQMRAYEVECHVYSVDIRPPGSSYEGISFLQGSGRNLDMVFSSETVASLPRPLLVIDDADHFPETTAAILNFFDQWASRGEYVVVEDGDAEKYYPGGYRGGPAVAIRDFLNQKSDGKSYRVDEELCGMFGITFNPNGYIQRVA